MWLNYLMEKEQTTKIQAGKETEQEERDFFDKVFEYIPDKIAQHRQEIITTRRNAEKYSKMELYTNGEDDPEVNTKESTKVATFIEEAKYKANIALIKIGKTIPTIVLVGPVVFTVAAGAAWLYNDYPEFRSIFENLDFNENEEPKPNFNPNPNKEMDSI